MLPDFGPVEEALLAWAASAGIRVDQVVLNRRGRPVVILPLLGAAPAQDSRVNIPLEILKVLREAGRRLTGVLVFEALCDRGVHTSDRTVNGHLADMVREGTLTNDPRGKPPGYGLPTDADGRSG